jgi:hypothetical protein
MLDYGDVYHVGIVVPDLDDGMAELADRFGISFPKTQGITFHVDSRAHGDQRVPLRFAYSHEGPPYLEVIEAVPGSPWALGDGSAIHHLGVFVDDLEGEIARLTARFGEVETRFIGPNGITTVCYVNSGLRTRIELVDAAYRENILAMTRP